MFDSVITLLIATFLMMGSPGPATLALAAIGATSGFKKGLPFLAGILTGLVAAITGASLGVASLFVSWPELSLWVQVLGAMYIIYIAYKIATAPILDISEDASNSVPGFFDGFILNLLNPKAYAAFFAIFSQFLLPFSEFYMSFFMTGLFCFMMGVLVDFTWLYIGGMLKQVFEEERLARKIRVVLASLMILAVAFTFASNY